jgi:hypothetical protein
MSLSPFKNILASTNEPYNKAFLAFCEIQVPVVSVTIEFGL